MSLASYTAPVGIKSRIDSGEETAPSAAPPPAPEPAAPPPPAPAPGYGYGAPAPGYGYGAPPRATVPPRAMGLPRRRIPRRLRTGGLRARLVQQLLFQLGRGGRVSGERRGGGKRGESARGVRRRCLLLVLMEGCKILSRKFRS